MTEKNVSYEYEKALLMRKHAPTGNTFDYWKSYIDGLNAWRKGIEDIEIHNDLLSRSHGYNDGYYKFILPLITLGS